MRQNRRPFGVRFLSVGVVLAVSVTGLIASAAKAAGPTPTFTISAAGSGSLSTPNQIASLLLGDNVSLASGTEATVNLKTASELNSITPSPLPAFGQFAAGDNDLGISSGLILSANSLITGFNTSSRTDRIALNRRSNDPAFTDAVALAAVTNAAGLGSDVNNATSLTFNLAPPPVSQPYLKFEYSLLITERGDWNGTAWSGEVFGYPDGFALFVGGTSVADNCAVVPGTSTYLSMQTAGIVPPENSVSAGQAAAEARLAARVGPPVDPGSANGFAYSTGELIGGAWNIGPPESRNQSWTVQFLTVPLTCVYDASAQAASSSPVSVQIVIGDLNDSSIPPAAVFKGSSVRWSGNATPTAEALLTVTKTGSGSGGVTSSPTGIDCGSTCSANFTLNSSATLTAAPASGSTFTGWTGACSGTGPCTVAMSEAKSVGAAFATSSPAPNPAPAPTPTPTPTPTPNPTSTAAPPNLDPITGGQNPNLPVGGVPLGGSVLLVNGEPAPVTVRPNAPRNASGLDIEGSGFTMQLSGRTTNNRPLGLTPDGALILEQDRTAFTQGTGFQVNSQVFLYLLSTPKFLGTVAVNAGGAFQGTVPLPLDIPAGRHTLQANGITTDGVVRSLSLGVQVQKTPKLTTIRKAKTTVYFAELSSTLDETAKRSLDAFARDRKKTATRVVVNGFVQSSDTTTNDESLSLARAKAVARYLKAQGVRGKFVVRADGIADETGAAGRKARVTISYRG